MGKNKLGFSAEDVITGFQGIITAKVEYLSGSVQYLIQPKVKEGQYREGQWFDEKRVRNIRRSFMLDSKNAKLIEGAPPELPKNARSKPE